MVKQEEELTILLTKLYAIQEQVGAVEKSSDQDKKNRAASAGQVQMGKGRKGKKTGSRFLELKSSIVDRLKSVHALQEGQESSVSLDPKVKIATQAEIRELVRQAQDEWSELNDMYKKEARKKKSKFTSEELEVQQALAALDAVDFESASNPSGGGKGWSAGPSGVAITDSQQVQLQQIRDRDAEFDQDLDEIGEGIQDLHELALRQGEEVKRQNQMLQEVGAKIDNAHEHMVNVNAKMKDTLNEVGRSSDKLCVDIMCIVLGIGLAAVIYKMATGGGTF